MFRQVTRISLSRPVTAAGSATRGTLPIKAAPLMQQLVRKLATTSAPTPVSDDRATFTIRVRSPLSAYCSPR